MVDVINTAGSADLSTLTAVEVNGMWIPCVDVHLVSGEVLKGVFLVKTPSLPGSKGNRPGGDLPDYTSRDIAVAKAAKYLKSGALVPGWTAPKGGIKPSHLRRQLVTGEDLAVLASDRAEVKAAWIEAAKAAKAASKVEQQVAAATSRPSTAKSTAAPSGPDIIALSVAMIGAGRVEEAMALLAKHGLL